MVPVWKVGKNLQNLFAVMTRLSSIFKSRLDASEVSEKSALDRTSRTLPRRFKIQLVRITLCGQVFAFGGASAFNDQAEYLADLPSRFQLPRSGLLVSF